MKILHINSYYAKGKFYKNLYDNQDINRVDIDVYVPTHYSFNDNGFDYGHYTLISKNHNRFDRVFFYLKHYKILKDITSKYKINDYSIIHAHSLFSNGYIAMRLFKKFKIPYIVAVRNTDVNVFFKKLIYLRSLGIEILRNASKIIFLSHSYKEFVLDKYIPSDLRRYISEKSVVIPNGVDKFWVENIGKPKKINKEETIKILQVGDINKNKNLLTTAKAISELIQEGFSMELNVVGKIVDKRIYNQITNYQFVSYLGYKSKEDLLKIYNDSHIFVLPSIYETFGLVYAEAMSQGLPIIYSKGQGFDGQFENGKVGFATESLSVTDLKANITDAIKKYTVLSEECILSVYKFEWDNISNSYFSIYEDITRI